jgi:hypothetical protein
MRTASDGNVRWVRRGVKLGVLGLVHAPQVDGGFHAGHVGHVPEGSRNRRESEQVGEGGDKWDSEQCAM